jgi:hypothetical protein
MPVRLRLESSQGHIAPNTSRHRRRPVTCGHPPTARTYIAHVTLGDQKSHEIKPHFSTTKIDRSNHHPCGGCALPRRPRLHVSSPAGAQPVTTAIEISPDSRHGSEDCCHLLAACDRSYKLVRSCPNPESNRHNLPRYPVAPHFRGSDYAQGNLVDHEQARRSGAILLAAGVLQRLIRLGGKKEPRNPPASARHCCPPPARLDGQSATGKVSLSHTPRFTAATVSLSVRSKP